MSKPDTPIVNVPMVRVLNEDGKEVYRGWYMMHINRQTACIGDQLKESDVDHLVMTDGFADWNMPKDIRPIKVTPPHTIEIVEEER